MKRVAIVSAVALVGSLIGVGFPARSDTPALFDHYVGALHQHSGYSDGFPGSRPADYFQSAKWHGLDFLMSGEHSDNADVPMTFSEQCLNEAIADCAVADKEEPSDSFRKWDATLEQAQAATDDGFTGARGFEWSSDRFGHINVYFSQHDTNAKIDGGYATMESFWEWFNRSPELGGGADGLATFNHPGDKSLDDGDPAFNWNDFAYVAAVDQRMVGIEVYNDNDEYGDYYVRALDKGWHLGAIGAEDLGHRPRDGDGEDTDGDGVPDLNFDDDWGGPKWAKTVMIATDRSVAGLREAMLARRFYAVSDNSIRLEMTAGGLPMGSRISESLDSIVPITVSSSGGTTIQLISNGGTVVASATGTDLTYDATVEGAERYYFVRVLDGGSPVAYSSPVWVGSEEATAEGQWLAGDLHIHTTYSHDSYGGPGDDNTDPFEDPPSSFQDLFTIGHPPESQFAVARARGLDYLAITDHNDIRSLDHFGAAGGLIPIGGYESSLRGHAQFLGVDRCYKDTGGYDGPDCGDHGDTSAAGVTASADAIREDGGIFQINHPMEGTVDHPNDPDWGYGYDVVPDTIEVWNISHLWQPPAPSASSNADAIRWWESWLDRGHRIGVTGGSDNHFLATTPVQGAGQPTTWVFATEANEQGVIEGLEAGRTFISHQPPAHGGPLMFLEADANGDGTFEAVVGDEVPPGSELRVRVERAPGSLLRVVSDGGEQAFPEVPVDSPSFEHRFTLPEQATWVRAEIFEPDGDAERKQTCDQIIGSQSTYCRNKLAFLAMTSALYLGSPDPEPAASHLSLAGTPSSGQYSDEATFSAQLADASGDPVAGEEVSFELTNADGSRSFVATTDTNGVARVTTILTEKPGPAHLTAHFAGSDDHASSSDEMGYVIEKEDTVLELEVDGRGAKRTLVATLSDEDSAAGVGDRLVEFYADGSLLGTGTTGTDGRAEFDPSGRAQGNNQEYEARFTGDDYYEPSSGTAHT